MQGALGQADQGPKAQTGRKSSGDFRGAEPMGRVPGEWETQPALTVPCTHTDTPPLLDPPSRPPMGSPIWAPASFGASMGQAWAWELSV